MKKIILSLLILLPFATLINAQNVGINNPTPAASSILDLTSTNKGLLIPRLTTSLRTSISSPAYGLMVCDTTLNAFYYWDKTTWRPFLTDFSGWKTAGNSGTNPAVNFLGTTDYQPLKLKVNNTLAGNVQPDGQIFLGLNSGIANTGTNNTALGGSALKNNSSGNDNTATGYQALYSNIAGVDNSAYGYGALYSNTTGGNNLAFGVAALYSNTTGVWNCALGNTALYSNTTGTSNVAFGGNALAFSTTANNNAAFGNLSLFHNTVGSDNTATGANSLSANTTGLGNVAIGSGALNYNTTGTYNTAIGSACTQNNTTASFNTAVGNQAMLLNTTASENTVLGANALNKQAFSNSNTVWNSENVAVGVNALYWNAPVSTTTGNRNTAVGHSALKANTTGSTNTALGYNAGMSGTGSNNTYIGANTVITNGSTNSTAIGNNALANASNKIRLGDGNVTVIEGQVAYSYPSDARFKFNIKNNIPGLDFIMQLKPVTYNFDTKKFEEHIIQDMPDSVKNERLKDHDFTASTNIIHSGFLAQDIEQACKQSGYDFDGLHIPDATNKTDNYSVAYSQFIMPLVKGMQEQQSLINLQAKTIFDLMSRIEKLESSK